MDPVRFDAVTRRLARGTSRRQFLKGLAGALGLGAAAVGNGRASAAPPYISPSTCPADTYPCFAYGRQPGASGEVRGCCTHDQVCLKCSAVDPQTGSTSAFAGCCTPGPDCDALSRLVGAHGRHATVCREFVG